MKSTNILSRVPIYAFSFTAPSIIYDLGYTAAQAQLLTIPIYLLAVCAVLFFSRIADRKKTRWPFVAGPYCFVAIGFIALLAIPHPKYPGLTYAFLFLIPAGCNPGVITLVTWISNNLAPTSKRATGLALSLMMANLGGAIGSNIYLVSEKPRYWTGYGVCLACTTVGICCTLVLRWAYRRENLKRDKMSEEEIRANYTERKLLLSLPFPQCTNRIQSNFWIWETNLHCTDTCIKCGNPLRVVLLELVELDASLVHEGQKHLTLADGAFKTRLLA